MNEDEFLEQMALDNFMADSVLPIWADAQAFAWANSWNDLPTLGDWIDD